MNYTYIDDFPLLQTTGYASASPRINDETNEEFTPWLGIITMLKLATTYSSHSIRKNEQQYILLFHRNTLINIKMINTLLVCRNIDNFGGTKDRVNKIKRDINPSELPVGTRTAQIWDQEIIAL